MQSAANSMRSLKAQATAASTGISGDFEQTSGAASRFTSSVGAQFGQLTQKISSFANGAATATSAAIAGFAIPTLFKGWQRMTSIQDSTVALGTALHDTTAAADLLNNVLNVVRGTPFNFDQFASAAQQMVGMGISADAVPGYLKAIGEASATQGGRANEFAQRLSTIYGQVAAQGRIMGDDIMQISQTGVNALAILGNHFGVTAGEMRDMVSKGAVPAKEALDVLSEGILNGSNGVNGATIAFAGTMEGLRKTLTGAIGGVKAAQARLGAAFLTPFSGAFTEAANVATAVIDKLTPVVKSFAEMIVANPGFKKFKEWLSTIPDKIPAILQGLDGMKTTLGPLIGMMFAMASTNIGDAFGPLGALIPKIGPLTGFLIGLAATSEPLRQSFAQLAQSIMPVVQSLSEAFAPVLDQVGQVIISLIPSINGLMPSIVDLVNSFLPLVPVLANLAGILIPILTDTIGMLLEAGLTPLMQAIMPIVTLLAQSLAPVIGQLGSILHDVLGQALTTLIPLIIDLANQFLPMIPTLSKLAIDLLPVMADILNTGLTVGFALLKDAIIPVVGFLVDIVDKVISFVDHGNNLSFVIDTIVAAFVIWKAAMLISAIIEAVTTAMGAMAAAIEIVNMVMSANPIMLIVIGLIALGAAIYLAYTHFSGFRAVVDAVWQGIQTAFHAAWDVISAVFGAIWSFISGVLMPIFMTFWNVIMTVWNAISGVITTVWNGVIAVVFTAIKVYIGILMLNFYLIWNVVKFVFEMISGAISWAWENVIKPIWDLFMMYINDILIPIFNTLMSVVSSVWDAISSAISSAWDFIKGVFNKIWDGVQWVLDKFFTVGGFISDAFATVGDLILKPFKWAFNKIVDIWNSTIGSMKFSIPFTDISFSAPKLDHWYHQGGYVQGPVGSDVPAMLQAGEYVLSRKHLLELNSSAPKTSNGNSNMNVTINMPPGSDGADVVDAIKKFERHNGPVFARA
jgi:tape measure domain-containing protein